MKLTYIYRITHYKNLPFILKNGIHCPNSDVQDPGFIPIGLPGLISRRGDRRVPVAPFGTLADYVPFYFAVKSPMLYVISMSTDPEVIKTSTEEIIYIVSSIEKLEELDVEYVFTDRHAKLSYARFYNHYDDLNNLRWDIIRSDRWGSQYGTDIKEYKQAECLIYRMLPLNGIIGFGCKTERMCNILCQMIREHRLELPVKIKSDWYF